MPSFWITFEETISNNVFNFNNIYLLDFSLIVHKFLINCTRHVQTIFINLKVFMIPIMLKHNEYSWFYCIFHMFIKKNKKICYNFLFQKCFEQNNFKSKKRLKYFMKMFEIFYMSPQKNFDNQYVKNEVQNLE